MISLLDRLENTAYQQFLLFLHCFLMPSFLTLSQTNPGFYVSVVQVFVKTLGKGEIARKEQCLIFPQCFLPFWRTFHQVHYCRLQTLSVWKSLKFVVWERVKGF